jgi:predicted acyl esterase
MLVCAALCSLPLIAACGGDNDDGLDDGGTVTPTQASAATGTPASTDTPVIISTPTATVTFTLTSTPPPTPTFTPTPNCPDRADLSAAETAEFVARGSVEQVYVIDAAAGTALELVDEDGCPQQSGTSDEQGSLIFRQVAPGTGYAVVQRSGPVLRASGPLDVRAPDDVPPPSFYESQEIRAGYGYLETRDGTRLAINVLIPGAIDGGPYPTVIEYSGYDPANPSSPQPSSLISFALGYAVVGVNIRGTGCSGGAFDFFETLQSTDGYDVVETIAAQPWVKGSKVGMVGISYPGISQLFTAQLQPPHLAAIAPLSVVADVGSVLYPGGILNNGFATSWADDRQRDAEPYPGGQPWARARIRGGDAICLENQKLHSQAPSLMERIEANPFYVPEVADPLSPSLFVHRINVPVFLAGAWQDEQTGPYFATMLDRFTGTDKVHFTLVNGNHSEPLMPAILGRWMEFLSLYVAGEIPRRSAVVSGLLDVLTDQAYGVTGLMLEPERFTDVTSYEEALARFESDPKVRLLLESGAGGAPGYPIPAFEEGFDEWPIASVEPGIWYFDENGALSPVPPAGEGADQFIYDPSRAQETSFTGSTSAVWRALPAWHWQPLEPGKALAYATEPLDEPLVMAGSGSVDLWLQSTAPDVDLQVTLSEIRPDGQESYVQSGWLRASRRKLDETASTELRPIHTHRETDAADLPAGELVEVRVEIYPFAHVFRAGSRLRISVAAPGGDRPHWKFQALPANGEVINIVSRSPATPSRVVLPVVPGIEVPTPLPPCPSLRGQPCREYEELINASVD